MNLDLVRPSFEAGAYIKKRYITMNEKTYKVYWIVKPSNMRGESAELMDYKTAKKTAAYLNKLYNGENGKEVIIHHVADYRYTDNWIEE